MISSVLGAVFQVGGERGLEVSLRGIGERLSLGKLDPNHDIARAARFAQISAELYLLHETKDAILAWQRDHLDKSIEWTGRSDEFERGIRNLEAEAGAVKRSTARDFEEMFPEGAGAAITNSVCNLLRAENLAQDQKTAKRADEEMKEAGLDASPTRAVLSQLADRALTEVVQLAGWTKTPLPLAERFADPDKGFAPTFAGFVAARFKNRDCDAFFRIWLVLRADAGAAKLDALLKKFEDVTSFTADRDAAARAMVRGSVPLEQFVAFENRLFDQLDRIERLVREVRDEFLSQLKQAFTNEGMIIGLAQQINSEVRDFFQARAELHRAVELAIEVAREGRVRSNLGAFVDDVLRRLAAKSACGAFDEAAAEADRAIAQWETDEQGRRAEALMGGLKILDAGLKQDILRRNPKAAATRIARMAELEKPADAAAQFDLLRRRQKEYYWSAVRVGSRIDLEISAELARSCLTIAQSPTHRGAAYTKLGLSLTMLGMRGDYVALKEGVATFRKALREQTPDRRQHQWFLAKALETMGQRGEDQAFEEAGDVFREFLEEFASDKTLTPKIQSSLGLALSMLDGPMTDENLKEMRASSLQAQREILQNPALAPTERQINQNLLAFLLFWWGDEEALNEALVVIRESLEEWPRDKFPRQWALRQSYLAYALLKLGERADDVRAFKDSIAAYREALKETPRDKMPLIWAMTKQNLGNALLALGRRGDSAALEEAIATYREVLSEHTRENFALDWARTTEMLVVAQEVEADRMVNRKTVVHRYFELTAMIKEAIDEFERARSKFDTERAQQVAARLGSKASENLGRG